MNSYQLGGRGGSHTGQTDPGRPSSLQLLDPATESCGRTPSKGPPGTEEQGQKSRRKNVVLPAFHVAARGQGWVSPAIPQEGSLRFMNLAHTGVEPAASSWGTAGFWKPCCGMQGSGLGGGHGLEQGPACVCPLWAPDLASKAVREPPVAYDRSRVWGGAAEVLVWLN